MIYLLVDLKLVLALHPSDQNGGWSEGRALTRTGALIKIWSLKATFHLTISMRGKRAAGKIQRTNYRHGSCLPSLSGETMSVVLIFTQGTNRNVKNRRVRSGLNGER